MLRVFELTDIRCAADAQRARISGVGGRGYRRAGAAQETLSVTFHAVLAISLGLEFLVDQVIHWIVLVFVLLNSWCIVEFASRIVIS